MQEPLWRGFDTGSVQVFSRFAEAGAIPGPEFIASTQSGSVFNITISIVHEVLEVVPGEGPKPESRTLDARAMEFWDPVPLAVLRIGKHCFHFFSFGMPEPISRSFDAASAQVFSTSADAGAIPGPEFIASTQSGCVFNITISIVREVRDLVQGERPRPEIQRLDAGWRSYLGSRDAGHFENL
jgi:hypothetical protein